MPVMFGIDAWAFVPRMDRSNAREVVEKASALDMPGTTWALQHLVSDPAAQLVDAPDIMRAAADKGFVVPACGFVPNYRKDGQTPSFSLSGDPEERRSALETGYSFIENTRALASAGTIARLGGPFYRMHGDMCQLDDLLYARLVGFLAKLAERAYDKGVELDFEPLNRFEMSGPNRTADAIALARDVRAAVGKSAEPSVKINFDTYHSYVEGEDPAASIKAVAGEGMLGSVHLGDTTRLALGTGAMGERFGEILEAVYSGSRGDNAVPVIPELFCPEFRGSVAIWGWPRGEAIPEPYEQARRSYELLKPIAQRLRV